MEHENRPTKDTGFRMKPQPPFQYTRIDRAIPRKRIWDFDHFHNDDLKDDGRALNAVRFVVPDCDAAAARNRSYLLESIGVENIDLTTVL